MSLYVDNFAKTGKLKLSFNSILLAVRLASYIQEAQMYFFGKKIMEALEDAENSFTPEGKRESKRTRLFNSLPKTFTKSDVDKQIPGLTNQSIYNMLSTWHKKGFIEIKKIKKEKTYVKLVNNI